MDIEKKDRRRTKSFLWAHGGNPREFEDELGGAKVKTEDLWRKEELRESEEIN